MRIRAMAITGLGLVGVSACHSAATRECLDLFSSAQAVVNKIDAKSQTSVEESLGAVERAMASCDAAGRNQERDSLGQARNELRAHLESLKERANRPKKSKLTPDQLQEFAQHGDPNCPKGQAYRDSDLKKEIRCTGPEPVDMNFAQAKHYFDDRGYKITATDAPPQLKAEYGAELLVFDFSAPNDTAPARCLSVYPPPGESWQEAASKVTGVSPKKLDPTGNVTTDHGSLALHVDNTEAKVLVRIGNCS